MDYTADSLGVDNLENSLKILIAAAPESEREGMSSGAGSSSSLSKSSYDRLQSSGTSVQTVGGVSDTMSSYNHFNKGQQDTSSPQLENAPSLTAREQLQTFDGPSLDSPTASGVRQASGQQSVNAFDFSAGKNSQSISEVGSDQYSALSCDKTDDCKSNFIFEIDVADSERTGQVMSSVNTSNQGERREVQLFESRPINLISTNSSNETRQQCGDNDCLSSEVWMLKAGLSTKDNRANENIGHNPVSVVFLPDNPDSIGNSIVSQNLTCSVNPSVQLKQVLMENLSSLSTSLKCKTEAGAEDSAICSERVKREFDEMDVEKEDLPALDALSESERPPSIAHSDGLNNFVGCGITLRTRRKPTWKMKELRIEDCVEDTVDPLTTGKGSFPCDICDRKFRSLETLEKHRASHSNAGPSSTEKVVPVQYTCILCNSHFLSKGKLTKHIEAHLEQRPYPCPECAERFRFPEDVKKHLDTHVSVGTFSCSKCPYTAPRQRLLNRHLRSHSEIRPHKCQQCGFTSKRKHTLMRHMETVHTPESIYKCTACNYKFSSLDSFKVHVAMHAASKSVACLICGAVNSRRPNLIEHLMSHSCDGEVSCHVCKETFTATHTYLLHLLNHKENGPARKPKAKGTKRSEFDLDIVTSEQENDPDITSAVYSNSRVSHHIPRNLIMDKEQIEANVAKVFNLTEKVMALTKHISFSDAEEKTASQLSDISELSTRMSIISRRMVHSFKCINGLSRKNVVPSSVSDHSNNENGQGTTCENGQDTSYENGQGTSYEGDDVESAAEENSLEAQLDNTEKSQGVVKKENADSSIGGAAPSDHDLNGHSEDFVVSEKTDCPEVSFGPEKKPLKCPRCDLLLKDTRSLKRHLLTHDDVRRYGCKKCGKTFRRGEHLKKHMVTHSDDRPFVCPDCPYAAKTKNRLKIHRLSHSAVRAFPCTVCSYTGRTRYELNHHMKRHERRECGQCGFTCFSRVELKRHVFTHSQFDCNECDFTTKDRNEFSKHMRKHHTVELLCCELCGYSCDTMKKFKYHKLRHENKTPLQCPDCDYKCSSRASFDCHRLKHAGLKPYLCSFCGSSFRKSSHLNQHMLIHKDEKAYKCSQCGYACRTKHNLKEHEMTHSGEKPFACKYCNFSCRRNKALQLHMEKHERSMLVTLQ